ncbi:hypothetical protein MPTK1_1g07640 [Marchantia polymorpha subsp. ruderalis]|uniref:HECT-type E3 ubiquitin transferase n=2 Tax=Marchantia polymorpha TaxID=3197 RepID=A0AAF6AMM6_MARPO|nr:hypothetical protein MARPO_0036s0010 [Marchantia polymorpha]BBM97696.1 hypothetical protein Mp_1g07640 [Marchantia polymorpha subsp. ruderalis]|eukprot:PTQ41001.1 hypothetical protein MARPO_0036s0010 [Marchantia polymorpha]
MVLSSLALSIRGLFRSIRLAALASRSRRTSSSSAMETRTMIDDERAGVQSPLILVPGVGVGVAVAEREREIGELREAVGFMMAARMASTQPIVSRTASSKRKLEELEIGIADLSGSANSQVRARREARDEDLEGSVAESSGRERYESGLCSSGEAQALDGESLMREEGGNEAIDADAMWEEEPGWNRTVLVIANCEITKVVAPEKGDADDVLEETVGVQATNEAGSSLTSILVPSQVDTGVYTGPSLGVAAVISGESLGPDAGIIGRGLVEEVASGKDSEAPRESEFDGLRSREKERDSMLFGHEEESSTRRYTHSLSTASGANLNESSINSSAGGVPQVSGSLSACVSSLLAVGCSGSGSGNDAESSCSTSGARVVDMDSSACRLQFFVRTYIEGRTIVLHAKGSDTVESVHQQIHSKTGLPVSEQRLIFRGRQLQQDQTLEDCHLANDATMFLVARMRSTALPHSWQLINDLVATIRRMCAVGEHYAPLGSKLMHSQDCVRAGVQEFLKMASKSVPVSEHMQVFQLAGATSALVMLLLSPIVTNRECAEESITLFLQANDEYLPSHIHCHCAPVLLDLCKLLAKSAPHHNLYASCRNSLARLLDSVGIAHNTPYFHEAKAETIVHDFSPFVNELSVRISQSLRFIAKSYAGKEAVINYQSYGKEAKDFTAFVIPLCKAMEVCKGIDASGSKNCLRHVEIARVRRPSLFSSDTSSNPDASASEERTVVNTNLSLSVGVGMEIGSHGWLRTLFLDLLREINDCLEAVQSVGHGGDKTQDTQALGLVGPDDRERSLGFAPFLVVLKGLHAVAKLYEGAMEDLLSVLIDKHTALNVLIRQSKWNDDDFWLLEHKYLLDFDSKRRLVMAMLPEPQDDHDERQEMVVHRSQLLTESFEALAYAEPDVLQGGISVEFATEEATGPGVLREWFSMICREIFNPQNALFLPCPNDRRRYFPNPASGVNPGHLTYFRFCGRVLALALMHRVQVDVVFALTFFKQLAGLPISWEDAKDADPCLYESCKKILEMDAETVDSDALGLTFVSEIEELGSRKTLELCQGGREMVVNSDNRKEFVELLVRRRLVTSVAEQIKSFSQGFSDLLVNSSHQQFLRALEPEDLDLMLYGKDRNICLEDWRKHTEYHDYTVSDDQIKWFWQVAEDMTPEQRRRLLFFSTSVTHLPAEGFAGLSSKFHIHRAHTDTSWLPTAHTCFYQLVLPAYPTFEIMHTRLHAITEVHIAEGFGFA